MTEIEKTNSGLKTEGSWHEITALCIELESLFEDYIEDKDEIERYDEWRPRVEENEEEIEEKTAEEAALDHKQLEEEFEGTEEELDEAEEMLCRSLHDVLNGESPVKDFEEALKDIEMLIGAKSVDSIRKVEEVIYKRLMLKFNPCYFDTEDFSVSLDHKKNGNYVFCVNMTDEDLRTHIQEELDA